MLCQAPTTRRRPVTRPLFVVLMLAMICSTLPASAQNTGFSLGLLGGVGGSPDSESYSGASFQVVAAWEWRLRTLAQLRIGQIDLDLTTDVGGVEIGADLTFIGLSTEYRYHVDYYDAGYIIGIGLYNLETDAAFVPGVGVLGATDDDAVGIHLGVSGQFRLGTRWSIPVELMGHYADFDAAQVFITAQAGLAIRF